MKFTNHTELRKRQSIDCSHPKITDPSAKKMADINNIMLQYSKTGLLPEQREKLAQYIDNTQIPSLEEAHDVLGRAKEMFYNLPAQIRKLMDNDPTKIVEFIKNPENTEILVKYGVLEKRKVEPNPSADPPAVAKPEAKPEAK